MNHTIHFAKKRDIQLLSAEFKNDLEIIEWTLVHCPKCFKAMSDEVKDHREFVVLAIENCGESLKFVSDRFKNDKEIDEMAVISGDDIYILDSASKEIRADIAFRKNLQEGLTLPLGEKEVINVGS